jgi:imidazoleglycerol-phosphate dehydratase
MMEQRPLPIMVQCRLLNLTKPTQAISTGIGYLDHMLDQFYSHAQVGVALEPILIVPTIPAAATVDDDADGNHDRDHDPANRHAHLDQSELLTAVGSAVGKALRQLLDEELPPTSTSSTTTFYCPLDEALVKCVIQRVATTTTTAEPQQQQQEPEPDPEEEASAGGLQIYDVAPYGKFPSTGRTVIGRLETVAIQSFWSSLAIAAGLQLQLVKLRGDNAHHIVEASFKAFCRALRNLLDGIYDDDDVVNADGTTVTPRIYDDTSDNVRASLVLSRTAAIHRVTKETSIDISLQLDGGAAGVQVATAASVSLTIHCRGDAHIDEHHTAEDIAIAVGQALNEALGDRAGLNRMWWSQHGRVRAVVDLSNRPCLSHNLHRRLAWMEFVGVDLSAEMLLHVLDSLTVQARMTVHFVQDDDDDCYDDDDLAVDGAALVTSTAVSLGRALKYCCMVDQRRAGTTASSKGTLSV